MCPSPPILRVPKIAEQHLGHVLLEEGSYQEEPLHQLFIPWYITYHPKLPPQGFIQPFYKLRSPCSPALKLPLSR